MICKRLKAPDCAVPAMYLIESAPGSIEPGALSYALTVPTLTVPTLTVRRGSVAKVGVRPGSEGGGLAAA